jgi:hypothetical protein
MLWQASGDQCPQACISETRCRCCSGYVVCDYDTDVTVTCVAYSDMLLAGETHHAEIARHYGVGAGIYSGNPSYYCQALLESS